MGPDALQRRQAMHDGVFRCGLKIQRWNVYLHVHVHAVAFGLSWYVNLGAHGDSLLFRVSNLSWHVIGNVGNMVGRDLYTRLVCFWHMFGYRRATPTLSMGLGPCKSNKTAVNVVGGGIRRVQKLAGSNTAGLLCHALHFIQQASTCSLITPDSPFAMRCRRKE